MQTKRIYSAILALFLMIALTPTSSAAGSSYVVNGVTVTTSSGTAVWNCSTYAMQVLKKIWTLKQGTVMTTYNNPYNLLNGKSADDRMLTEAHVQKYIEEAPLGSRIRVCASSDTTTNNYDNSSKGHTMVLVAKNPGAKSFTVLEAGGGTAKDTTYTYKGFANHYKDTRKYPYFFYIADYSAAATNKNATEENNIVNVQPSSFIANGTYTLTPQCAPNLRLDVAGSSTDNKANIQIYQDNGTPAQQFDFEYQNDGYYSITAKASGKCLDVQEGKKVSGTNVWQYAPNTTDAQKWKLEDAGDGYYYIIPKLNDGLCLDVYAAKSESGTNVQVYNKNQTSAQKWRLIPLDVPPENTASESSPVPTYYTVTLNANGGQVSSTTITVKQGSTYETLPIPTQSGYIFDGWYTAASGGEKITATSSLAANNNHTLYAHWTADVLYSGTHDSLNFSLSYDGTLTISGTGAVDPFFVGNGSPLEKYVAQIKNIVIKEGITSIFNGCRYMPNLVDVELPLSLTSINLSSFVNCPSLKTIYIPQNVSEISLLSFSGCSSLTNIQISDQNSWYSSMDGVVFNKTQNTLILFPEGRSGNYTIPSGVTTVAYGAFSKEALQNLTKLEIPKSVTEIKCDDWQLDNWQSVKLLVYSGSYGEEFAKKNSLNYEVVDKITVRLDLGSLLG